jgi:hypothetical protein
MTDCLKVLEMARPPRRRPASDDDSDSDEGASVSRPAVETEAEKYQKLIMMVC